MIDAFLAPPFKTTFNRKTIRVATTHCERTYVPIWNSWRYSRCCRRKADYTMQYTKFGSAGKLLF